MIVLYSSRNGWYEGVENGNFQKKLVTMIILESQKPTGP
jgi:hypothetical protein